ncbi:protein phosphatase 1 regulatory subunit 1C-like [Salvelinus fontinalis]|uniref:protein phosphatase 1 regulatory subunit 1C-like n=1 Tax=Salvelinus fontinalis TaxID=8038 RepID=UPI0024868FB3|nr:protein phosphatase 1 regulatory subunit 1C-like [Salvelinus fontinalis]
MEPNSPKKIQFAVPPFQSQLDPQAAEHIRRRRPTPATLVIYQEPSGAEADGKRTTSSSMEDLQGADLSSAQRKQSTFIPPTVKELQMVMDQNFQKPEHLEAGLCENTDQLSPITAQHYGNTAPRANHNEPDEPNGNELYANHRLLANGGLSFADSNCTGETSTSQQDNLSSPTSISR